MVLSKFTTIYYLYFSSVLCLKAWGMSHISRWTVCPTLTAICLLWLSSSLSLRLCQASEQVNSSMTALQAEKERLMRSVSEKEAELSSLRQAAQAQQSSLQHEQERNSRELGELQGKLQEKVSSQDSRAVWTAECRLIIKVSHYNHTLKWNITFYKTLTGTILVIDMQFTLCSVQDFWKTCCVRAGCLTHALTSDSTIMNRWKGLKHSFYYYYYFEQRWP